MVEKFWKELLSVVGVALVFGALWFMLSCTSEGGAPMTSPVTGTTISNVHDAPATSTEALPATSMTIVIR